MVERLVSRLYRPDPERCCEGCVFGGEHADWCPVENSPEPADERGSGNA
jgi:hypothetical protein